MSGGAGSTQKDGNVLDTDEEEPLDSACKVLEKLEFYGYLEPSVVPH